MAEAVTPAGTEAESITAEEAGPRLPIISMFLVVSPSFHPQQKRMPGDY